MTQQAVIYCRVSSVGQVVKGDGLNSQETRCQEYAKHKGYEVIEIFKDDVSGGLINRPGMQSMLKFLKKHKQDQLVVIIDDISRLARGLEAHIQLRTAIGDAGGKLESPSVEFGEDSDSQLVENLLASVSQHQRQKNAEQVANRMRSRMLNGYWVFQFAIGYRYERVAGHGKMLVKDEPVASIIKEALEGYACGKFETQTEVQRFLETQAAFPKDRLGRVHCSKVQNMLTRVIYAGYLTHEEWNIINHPGKHEPIISFETWKQIQDKLKTQAKVSARKDIECDFPLRGFILCDHCKSPMTSGWSHGRNAKYGYYYCFAKGCPDYKKSIRKEQLEQQFENILIEMQPAENLIGLGKLVLSKAWENKVSHTEKDKMLLREEIRQIEKKVDLYLNRIIEADSPSVIKSYENQVKKLEEEKIIIAEKVSKCGTVITDFNETFRTAFDFLGNPHKLWTSEQIEIKRTVLKFVFAEKLQYRRNEGFRTAAYSLPFLFLEDLKQGGSKVVEGEGFEPSNSCEGRFTVCCH